MTSREAKLQAALQRTFRTANPNDARLLCRELVDGAAEPRRQAVAYAVRRTYGPSTETRWLGEVAAAGAGAGAPR